MRNWRLACPKPYARKWESGWFNCRPDGNHLAWCFYLKQLICREGTGRTCPKAQPGSLWVSTQPEVSILHPAGTLPTALCPWDREDNREHTQLWLWVPPLPRVPWEFQVWFYLVPPWWDARASLWCQHMASRNAESTQGCVRILGH